MDGVYVVASAFRAWLVGPVDWVFGCSHRRTTFPRTVRTYWTKTTSTQ